MRWDLVESSLRDSPKGLRSLLGTRREIARKKTAGLVTIMLKAVGLCGRFDLHPKKIAPKRNGTSKAKHSTAQRIPIEYGQQ
ncbi:hypothetical protein BHM03_00051698 [Ensete ventricosum]|nr:hypothetical protein BHM03_00051698 [Ensete ventricosum]